MLNPNLPCNLQHADEVEEGDPRFEEAREDLIEYEFKSSLIENE